MRLDFDLSLERTGFALAARASVAAPITALFGPSGCGKSTLLAALLGLREGGAGAARGPITLGGRRLDGLPVAQRRLGWVPQEASLFPHLDVAGQLRFAARAAAGRSAPAAGAAAATAGDSVERAIDALELRPLLGRRAHELSGGVRPRVAIARALASAPDRLLLDEPLAASDRPLRARIVPFLARLPRATGVPLLCVTHDPHEVLALADEVLVMEAGRIVAQGAPREVLPAGAAFGALEALAAENLFEVRPLAGGDAPGGALALATARGCVLQMASVPGVPAPRRVAIRAEDVLLAAAPPGAVSAQNVLAGQVLEVQRLGRHAHVILSVDGERFTARVTDRAVQSLGLVPGRLAWLLIKAHAVHAAPD